MTSHSCAQEDQGSQYTDGQALSPHGLLRAFPVQADGPSKRKDSMPRTENEVNLTVSRDAAADLRVVRAELSRDRGRPPTLSQVIRALVSA